MKWLILFILLISFFPSAATRVETVADLDWDDPKAWTGGSVPGTPDTILIRHYVTFNRDLFIKAPTVLLIKREGTLCGDHLLDVECGAQLINNGVLYVRNWRILDGFNYYIMTAKNSGTITACNMPGFGKGFHIIPPEGNYNIHQFGQCKTSDTRWPREVLGFSNQQIETDLEVYPVPFNTTALHIFLPGKYKITIHDALGRMIVETDGLEELDLDLTYLTNGFYSLRVTQNNLTVQRKILKQ